MVSFFYIYFVVLVLLDNNLDKSYKNIRKKLLYQTLKLISMKKLLTIMLFVFVTTVSFAQSTTFITHAIPIGKAGDEHYLDEWADTYLSTNKQWIIAYEGVWVMLSEDGKTVSISEYKPKFTDALTIISSEEFMAYEEKQWNLPGEVQTKKFKYDYKDYNGLRYLVVTVKFEKNQKRHF